MIRVFVISLMFIALFVVADPNLHSVDKRIYSHYTASLVQDLDLNVVNQIPAKEAWLLTSTLNYPDVHSNGTAVAWAPFFTAVNPRLYSSVQVLANLFWGITGLMLMWFMLRRLHSRRISAWTMSWLLLISPAVWFLIYQPENADLTSLAFAAALLLIYTERGRFSPPFFSFLFGFFLLSAGAVKFDLLFYGLFFFHFLYEHRKHPKTELLTSVIFFAAGALIMFLPASVNESLKSGFPDFSYLNTITGGVYVLSENLFSPSGYFRTQPMWPVLILVFGSLVLRKSKWVSSLAVVALLVPLTEVLLESFNYNQNESLSARHWINDLPCWALVTAAALEGLERPYRRIFLLAGGLTGGAFTLAGSLVYRLDFDTYFFTGQWWPVLRALNPADLFYYLAPKNIAAKLDLWPLALICLLLFFSFFWIYRRQAVHLIGLSLFLLFSAGYMAITVANVFYNPRSAQMVPERVAKAVIGSGPYLNNFFENAGCLQRAVEFYERRGKTGKARHRQAVLENYVRLAAQEITHDPVGFKDTLKPGRKQYVPENLWSDK